MWPLAPPAFPPSAFFGCRNAQPYKTVPLFSLMAKMHEILISSPRSDPAVTKSSATKPTAAAAASIYLEQRPAQVPRGGIYRNSNRGLLLPVCTLKCFLLQLGAFGVLSLGLFFSFFFKQQQK